MIGWSTAVQNGLIVGDVAELGDRAAEYGYWAVLLIVAGDGVFPALPGETAIVAAAVLAATGSMNLPLVILAGAVGAMIGDSAAYWIGRAGSDRLRAWMAKMAGPDRLAAAERMVRRQGPALVFTGRFLPGIRIAINISCGAGQMTYRRFLLFDGLGAVVWSGQAALLGYFAGKAFADQIWVAFAVAFGVTAIVASFVGIRERRQVRRERAAADAEAESAGSGGPGVPEPPITPTTPPSGRGRNS